MLNWILYNFIVYYCDYDGDLILFRFAVPILINYLFVMF